MLKVIIRNFLPPESGSDDVKCIKCSILCNIPILSPNSDFEPLTFNLYPNSTILARSNDENSRNLRLHEFDRTDNRQTFGGI